MWPCSSRLTKPCIDWLSTPSSVAIHLMPWPANSGSIGWPTLPSAGPMPRRAAPAKARRRAEDGRVLLDGPREVDGCILRVASGVARQLDARHRLPRQLLVDEQRQYRMEIRRRGQLDLTAVGQLLVQGNDLAQDLNVLV